MATQAADVAAEPTFEHSCDARRLVRVREAHERAAVGEPAVGPALAELELELEVPVLLDRVPEHAQAADRRDVRAGLVLPQVELAASAPAATAASEASEPSKSTSSSTAS